MSNHSGYYALILLGAAVAAFWPRYLSVAPRTIDAYTHVHAFSMLAWCLLLIVQPFLIRARMRRAHRALGAFSYVLAPMVVISSLLLAHQRFKAMTPIVFAAEVENLYLPVSAVVMFAFACGFGLFYRRVQLLHATFMAGTGLTLVDPILGRILGFYLPPLPDPVYYQAITFGSVDLILLGVILNGRTEAQTRWACKTMLSLFVPLHTLWFTLAPSAAWETFARWFRALPLT